MKTSAKKTKNKPVAQQENFIRKHLPYLLILLFSIILYGNTLSFDYALDDLYAITGNSFTQKGIAGIPDLFSHHFFAGYLKDKEVMLAGGRYRPLSLVSFALEHEAFGKNPGVSHFFNVLFYALTGMLLFALMRKFAKSQPLERSWASSLPFLAILLFLAHPVHTEVVANIKGRDEIFALLGSLGALWFAMRYLEKRKFSALVSVFLCFFLALLSKENAILWLVLLPLTLWFFSEARFEAYVKVLLPMVLATLIFLVIRILVLKGFSSTPSTELLDNPYLYANTSKKFATIFYTLLLYLKLLFYPHPLSWDYYPFQITLHNFGDRPVWTSMLIYVVLVLLALWGFRNKRVYSFSIFFYLIGISLATNVFFGIGTFMAERFLYLSSLGFVILIAWLATTRLPVIFTKPKLGQQIANGLIVVILLLFTVKTIARNSAWKDDYTLYTTDVETSANSAKGNNMAGQWFAWRASQPEFAAERYKYLQEALSHLQKAVSLYPTYQDALFALGNVYYDYDKNIDSTIWCYTQILKLDPEENSVFRNVTLVLDNLKDKDAAMRYWEKIRLINPSRFESNYKLAILYSDKDISKAISLMEMAERKQAHNPDVLKFLGDGYYMKQNYAKTCYYWEKAIQDGSTDPKIRENLRLVERMR
ncbi:MAG: hypothetical protein WCO63_04670 [Bacteroidota bacterium]